MFADSFVIRYKVKFCDCYAFVCLKYKGKFCESYTAEMWLLHQIFICLNNWKLYSAIFEYKVKFLNKKLCSKNCGWLKETFWQYVTIHGLDKYNTMFQNVKRVLHQNKAHTKISLGWQFCRSISYTFNLSFLLIFLLSFFVNLRIALSQQ